MADEIIKTLVVTNKTLYNMPEELRRVSYWEKACELIESCSEPMILQVSFAEKRSGDAAFVIKRLQNCFGWKNMGETSRKVKYGNEVALIRIVKLMRPGWQLL